MGKVVKRDHWTKSAMRIPYISGSIVAKTSLISVFVFIWF